MSGSAHVEEVQYVFTDTPIPALNVITITIFWQHLHRLLLCLFLLMRSVCSKLSGLESPSGCMDVYMLPWVGLGPLQSV